MIQVYKAFIESLLRYCIIIWGGLYKTTLRKLNIAQNYILKVIHKKGKLFPTAGLYSEDILDVRSLYILSTCIFVHKHNSQRAYIEHLYDTRAKSNKHLKIPGNNRNINKKFLTNLAPKTYNFVPTEIRDKKNPVVLELLVKCI